MTSEPDTPPQTPTGVTPTPPHVDDDAVLVPRLIVLAVLGSLMFVPPLLRLWEGSAAALFGVWGGLIAVLAWLMERRGG